MVRTFINYRNRNYKQETKRNKHENKTLNKHKMKKNIAVRERILQIRRQNLK